MEAPSLSSLLKTAASEHCALTVFRDPHAPDPKFPIAVLLTYSSEPGVDSTFIQELLTSTPEGAALMHDVAASFPWYPLVYVKDVLDAASVMEVHIENIFGDIAELDDWYMALGAATAVLMEASHGCLAITLYENMSCVELLDAFSDLAPMPDIGD